MTEPIHIPDDKLTSCAERAKGKVVVITGGANGIGKEAALRFAKHGAKIVIGDLDEIAGRKTVVDIEAAGGSAAFIKCNVVQWDDLVALFELGVSKYGTVDIVIPNAGIGDKGTFEVVKFDEKGKPVKPRTITLDVNLTHVFLTVHLAQHYLTIKKKEGDLKAVVLIGSMASWTGLTGASLYSASKHAVLGFMRSMTQPLEARGIRIAVIHPWFSETNILPLPLKLFLAGIPMVPIERIAGAIFYAATDPDWETNGSSWLLPDDGPVFYVPKEEFKFGVYKMIDDRTNAIFKGAKAVKFYPRLAKDIYRHTKPLWNTLFIGAVGAYVWKNQDWIIPTFHRLVSQIGFA
ncbi:NAD(P)-binding protein [Coprinellus micaceus]|uniref:NAD(P)-binding protein n=1 Tax=Coprinellus micaceus TaxID=71717 RepID=A0A4Y7T9Y7_COPMI|nr:NAD(P)-binding protein [Coprinellus micaceus]